MKIGTTTTLLLVTFLMAPIHASARVDADSEALSPPVLETDQVLFLIDNSSSMTMPSFRAKDLLASRWDVVLMSLPDWIEELPTDTLVGAVSVGGDCGAQPELRMPVGSERKEIVANVLDLDLQSFTNLNQVLLDSPTLFREDVQGGKRIVLLSDGENTCPPDRDTCEIVETLHRDHGVRVDIVAWLTDSDVRKEFECMARVSGGTLTVPDSNKGWIEYRVAKIDPWPYIVLALGFLALAFTSIILYRHAVHAWRLAPRLAVLAGWFVILAGTMLLYAILFAGSGILAGIMALAVLALVIGWSARPRKVSSTTINVALAGLVACLMLTPRPALAWKVEPLPECTHIDRTGPKLHHLLALDGSVSALPFSDEMKALVRCYANMFVESEDVFTLVLFSFDTSGSAREVTTLTIPPDGSTSAIDSALAEVSTMTAEKTVTLHHPLADFLADFLKTRVRLEPVILVLGDGKSDAGKLMGTADTPFEAFGPRGLFTAPGVKGWKVAVQGGSVLDLSQLFAKRIVGKTRGRKRITAVQATPAISPCLVDPDILVTTNPHVTFTPAWYFPSGESHSTICVEVANDCAPRERSFTMELVASASETIPVGKVDHTLVETTPRTFCFPVTQAHHTAGTQEGSLRLVLDDGRMPRSVYATPASIMIEDVPYLKAHGLTLGLVSASLLFVLLASGAVLIRRRRKRLTEPLIVKPAGDFGVLIHRGDTVTGGGEGATIVIPEVPTGIVVFTLAWDDTPGTVDIATRPPWRASASHGAPAESIRYRLGTPLRFTDGEREIDFPLHRGTPADLGFGSAVSDSGSADWQSSDGFNLPSLAETRTGDSTGLI